MPSISLFTPSSLPWIAVVAAFCAANLGPASAAEQVVSLDLAQPADPREAAVLMVEGKADWLQDGVTRQAEVGHLVPPGAALRTGRSSELVLFFRQIGTMIRLRPETTLGLEKMTKYMRDGVLLKETVLDLQQGELMCVVRVLAEDSKFQIRIPGYSLAFDGAGTGRFDVNAGGNVLVGKKSERPLRVTDLAAPGQNRLVAPGCSFSRQTGEVRPASEEVLAQVTPKLDHLQGLGKALTPPPRPEELPHRARKKAAAR